jgi:hypothetical protein
MIGLVKDVSSSNMSSVNWRSLLELEDNSAARGYIYEHSFCLQIEHNSVGGFCLQIVWLCLDPCAPRNAASPSASRVGHHWNHVFMCMHTKDKTSVLSKIWQRKFVFLCAGKETTDGRRGGEGRKMDSQGIQRLVAKMSRYRGRRCCFLGEEVGTSRSSAGVAWSAWRRTNEIRALSRGRRWREACEMELSETDEVKPGRDRVTYAEPELRWLRTS